MNKPIAWSYTALTAFETCPRQFYRTRVKKDIPDPPGEAALWGQRVHKALELAVKDGTPLPEGMEQWQGLVDKLSTSSGYVRTEHQYAINKDFQPTSWFAKDVWCRGVVDISHEGGSKIVALDYKTGKRKPDSDQMELFAGLMFAHYPKAETIYTGFVWLKEKPGKQIDKEKFERKDVPVIWQNFLPRVSRLEAAHANNAWPAKPSGLCKAYCAVLDCEFNGRRGK